MRTPNAGCIICGKPLYRRPSDMARSRFAACMTHRAEAQKVVGITSAQHDGLKRGRVKGTNWRTGYSHRDESKRKASATHRLFWADHPELLEARAAKIRGAKNYNWKGGITKLNKAVRQMRENRKWMDSVKARYGACVRCDSTGKLEAHHVEPLAVLIERHGIRSTDDARLHRAALWNIDNGVALCEACHYVEHGRRIAA